MQQVEENCQVLDKPIMNGNKPKEKKNGLIVDNLQNKPEAADYEEEIILMNSLNKSTPQPTYENRLSIIFKDLQSEISIHNYDMIKFASYRTASKLRYVQRRTFLHEIDLWNVIEAFREGNLNGVNRPEMLTLDYVICVLNRLYSQLRLRISSLIDFDQEECVERITAVLYAAFGDDGDFLRTNAFKTVMVCLCSSKVEDKLRYLFTLCSDSNGLLNKSHFDRLLKDFTAIPSCFKESPSYGFSNILERDIFDKVKSVNVNEFLSIVCHPEPPQFVTWIHVLWRITNSESVVHQTYVCRVCNRKDFTGLRYTCLICHSYHLCQICFWRGHVSDKHQLDHSMTEFQVAQKKSNSLKRTLSNSSQQSNSKLPIVVSLASECDNDRRHMDLTHVVPVISRNGGGGGGGGGGGCNNNNMSTNGVNCLMDSDRADDEHRLIARYAARLAADADRPSRSTSELNAAATTTTTTWSNYGIKSQKEIVAELEARNKEITEQIERVKKAVNTTSDPNPSLLAELRILRSRRDELEARMQALQESRRELMVQLESLMTLLKSSSSSVQSSSNNNIMTAGGGRRSPKSPVRSEGSRSLRNDLLVAADSLTNAMSCLVRDLHSGESDDEEVDEEDEEVTWMKEKEYEERFMMELAARENSSVIPNEINYEEYHHNHQQQQQQQHESAVNNDDTYDNEEPITLNQNLLDDLQNKINTDDVEETDAESYIRTEDEDDGTEWEEAMRRWVNR